MAQCMLSQCPTLPSKTILAPFYSPHSPPVWSESHIIGQQMEISACDPLFPVTVPPPLARDTQVRNVNHQSWVSPNKNSPVLKHNEEQRAPLPGLPQGLGRCCGSGFNWWSRPRGGPCSTYMSHSVIITHQRFIAHSGQNLLEN